MYKNCLTRLFLLTQVTGQNLTFSKISKKPLNYGPYNWSRLITTSHCLQKKRRSEEEKAAESHGRRVIRYSPKGGTKVVGIWRNMTVQEIADVLKKDVDHVFKTLEFADKESNRDYKPNSVIYNQQIIREIVKISGCRFKLVANPNDEVEEEENKDALPGPPSPEDRLQPRPPVVCVMGHVDHGKTTLLDALRDTNVVDQEFGGITQHIGAFQVTLSNGERVTFLDTPGHAAFAAMRTRGAGVTDLVLLVVAADDGVMEQTVQSIDMARQASVPIMVAVNKIDKPGVNIERSLHALAAHGVVAEQLGGTVQAVAVSALRRRHLPELLDALSAQAQLLELKADPSAMVEGAIIESQIHPSTGKQATVLVQRGTLRKGSVIVAGHAWAKVRSLRNAEGVSLSSAPPATPVAVLGWRELPAAGDLVLEVESEKRASEVLRWRHQQREKERQLASLDAIKEKDSVHERQYRALRARRRALGRMKLRPEGPREKMIQHDDSPALNLLVKGDVDGTVEAIIDILDTYDEHERVKLDLVHFGVGPVTPNDLEIAEAFNAKIYTFNVGCPPALAAEAKQKNISIKEHNVIYKLIDDVKEDISEQIPNTQKEEFVGEANVLQLFHVSEGRRKLPVAGCRCVKGSLARAQRFRVIRGQDVIYEGKLASMKHLKDEVTTIKCDTECGLRFEDPTVEVQPGDKVVCYKMVEASERTGWDPGF